jgi:hypothetical protein
MEAIAVVAAAIENGQRNAPACHEIQDQPVASSEVGVAEPHLTKSIVLVRITTRNPEGKIRCEELEGPRQRLFQGSEIFRAADVPGQCDIQRTRHFLGGIISTNMNRIGEDAVVHGKDIIGPVALVRVGINDKNALIRVRRMKVVNGDRDIVENAIAKSAVGKGMVSTASKIASETIFERRPHGRDSPGSLSSRTGQQFLACRQPKANAGLTVQAACPDARQIVRRVDALELRDRSRLNQNNPRAWTFSADDLLGAPELVHGKWMLLRQRIRVARMVEATHAGNMGMSQPGRNRAF